MNCGSLSYVFFFFKQKTAYEMRISDWSSDVCSSDLFDPVRLQPRLCRSLRLSPVAKQQPCRRTGLTVAGLRGPEIGWRGSFDLFGATGVKANGPRRPACQFIEARLSKRAAD